MLIETVWSVVNAGNPGSPPPSHLELMQIRLTPLADIRALPHPQMRLMMSAQLSVCFRLGLAEEARDLIEVIEAASPCHDDLSLPSDIGLAYAATLTEAHLTLCDPSRAMYFAQRFAEYASFDEVSWQVKYRAHATLALCLVLNGRAEEATDALADMEALGIANGWSKESSIFTATMARLVLAFLRFDTDAARMAAAQLRESECPHSEPVTHLWLDVADALVCFLEDDAFGALALAARLTKEGASLSAPRSFHPLATYLLGFFLVRAGEPLRALGTVKDLVPFPHHMVCPAGVRGVAYLQLGEFARALAATGDCVKKRAEHAVCTYVTPMLARAIAHLRLGRHERAAIDAAEALSHVRQFSLCGILCVFDAADLTEIFDLVETHIPHSTEYVAECRQQLDASGGATSLPAPPAYLTNREYIVAGELRSTRTFPEIAGHLFVSAGTVKTQAASIYRKLGVGTRREAVLRLEEIGFYEL